MRKINQMFSVDDDGYLVKTSNGQRVPEDEPVFILRGRDILAAATIHHYAGLMAGQDADVGMRMFELGEVVHDFLEFKRNHPERMKQPGITKGK